MSDRSSAGARTLESFRKEAKQWLASIRQGSAAEVERLRRILPSAPAEPSLRDVQLAVAREHGFAGWNELKSTVEAATVRRDAMLRDYNEAVDALLEAYHTGTPEAMERHYRHTWHRRAWKAMRSYVQLDVGKRPAHPDDDVEITREDAQ